MQSTVVQLAGCGPVAHFVVSDGKTGNSRMIQHYRVRIYDNVPWGTFPYNDHGTSSLEGPLRNEDEDTQIKMSERNRDQGGFQGWKREDKGSVWTARRKSGREWMRWQ